MRALGAQIGEETTRLVDQLNRALHGWADPVIEGLTRAEYDDFSTTSIRRPSW